MPWLYENDAYGNSGVWSEPSYFSGAWYGVVAGAVMLLSGVAMFFLARGSGVRFRVLWIAATLALSPMALVLLVCLHNLPRAIRLPGLP